MLFAKRTPTVKARATGGTCFASGDASTTRSRPLTTWYRVLEETPRKTPEEQTNTHPHQTKSHMKPKLSFESLNILDEKRTGKFNLIFLYDCSY